MEKCYLTALMDAFIHAGGRLSPKDGKLVLVACKPLPGMLTERLFSRRAEIIGYLERGDPAVRGV
jgi:hypothetical protein